MSLVARLCWLVGYRRRGFAERVARFHEAMSSGDASVGVVLLDSWRRAWTFERANGSRRSQLDDFDHLDWLCQRTAELHPELAAASDRVREQVRRLGEVVRERSNFRTDGRMAINLTVAQDIARRMKDLESAVADWRKKAPSE